MLLNTKEKYERNDEYGSYNVYSHRMRLLTSSAGVFADANVVQQFHKGMNEVASPARSSHRNSLDQMSSVLLDPQQYYAN